MEPENEIYELAPVEDKKDKDAQRKIIWALTLTLIFVILFVVGGSAMSLAVAERMLVIEELVFWFCASIFGIVATFFGADIMSSWKNNTVSIKKKT